MTVLVFALHLDHGGAERVQAADPTPTGAPVPFPTPGRTDAIVESSTFNASVPGIGILPCAVDGVIVLNRFAVGDGLGDLIPPNGLDDVLMGITFIKLAGVCGLLNVTLRENPDSSSACFLEEQKNNTPGTLELDADLTCSLFYVAEAPPPVGTVHNVVPVVHTCKVSSPTIVFVCSAGASVPFLNPPEDTTMATVSNVVSDLQAEFAPVGGIVEPPDAAGPPLETPDSSGPKAKGTCSLVPRLQPLKPTSRLQLSLISSLRTVLVFPVGPSKPRQD